MKYKIKNEKMKRIKINKKKIKIIKNKKIK